VRPAARPPPPAPAPEPAPNAPPPKCEALEEGCVTKEIRGAIGNTTWTYAVPVGWTYARQPEGTIAVTPAAAIAFEVRDVPSKTKPPRDEALAAVVQRIGIELPKTKGKYTWPAKPDKTISVRGLAVALYQINGATRAAKHGAVLVFTTMLPDGRLVVGAGFVADDDDKNADADILKAVESIENEKAHGVDGGAP
jgi:hypothetical protein